MSIYFNINTLCNDKILKDLVIPSCLFINPEQPKKQFHKLNLEDDFIIDEKLYNIFLKKKQKKKKIKKYKKKYKKKTKKKK